MERTVRKLSSEGQLQAIMSRQDSEPLLALLHNMEAAASIRAAKKLAEESGVLHQSVTEFLDELAELSQDQDILMRALLDQSAAPS